MVLRREETALIDEIEERPLDLKKMEEMPGVTVYLVQPGDTLWDIAKKFYTTTEQIRRLNQIGTQEPEPYQPLMLVKEVADRQDS